MRLTIRLITFFFTAILFSIFLRGSAFAVNFKVTGTAIDNTNNPVVNAKVTATNILTQQTIATSITNQNGYYTLYVPKGTYNITTAPPLGSGLQPTTYSHITISSDMALHSNLNKVSTATGALSSIQSSETKKNPLMMALLAFVIILVTLIVLGLVLWKKKTPQASH